MIAARILVVEDEAILALGLQDSLQRLGHRVVGISASGEEACDLAETLRPDLVLMDIRLDGEMDGIDAGCHIRARLGLPVIFLTAFSDDETIRRATCSEPFGYLHKPCHERDLRTTIEMALHKHARERRLVATVRDFSSTLASIAEGIIAVDSQGQVTLLNRAAEQLTGWTREEALGQPIEMVFPLVDDHQRQYDRHPVKRALSEDRVVAPERKAMLVNRQGHEVPIEVTTTPIHRDGQSTPTGAVLAFHDASLRWQSDSQLRQVQKLEALGVMAGGIAHDFNNLLTPIVAYTELLRAELPPCSPGARMLDHIEESARRATDITRQILAFAGGRPTHSQGIDLSALARGIAGLLCTGEFARTRVQLDLAEDLALIDGDPDQIQQLVLNLLTNAAEAIERRPGSIILRTGRRWLSKEQLRESLARDAVEDSLNLEGEFVFLDVVDTGLGMTTVQLERIFDPFFSTKAYGRGLGLAAVVGIVRGHRGALFVHSVPERGSTFEVLFRARLAEPAKKSSERPAPPAPSLELPRERRTGGRVLIVDDESGILNLVSQCLKHVGLQPLAAGSGAEAVELLLAHAGDIDLALIDLLMPIDDGPATIRQLRQHKPSLPVLLMSGYTLEDAAARCAGQKLSGIIQKPFNLSQLVGLVERMIHQNISVA